MARICSCKNHLGYLETILVHPTRRQSFAGKSDSTFYNIWDLVIWWIEYKKVSSPVWPSSIRWCPHQASQAGQIQGLTASPTQGPKVSRSKGLCWRSTRGEDEGQGLLLGSWAGWSLGCYWTGLRWGSIQPPGPLRHQSFRTHFHIGPTAPYPQW